MRLRLSKPGFALAVTFLLVAGALFALHVQSFRTNPANPGDTGLWFFLCTLPWAFLLPDKVTGAPWWSESSHYVEWALVAWNAFLVYCACGGLTFAPRARAQARRSSLTSR